MKNAATPFLGLALILFAPGCGNGTSNNDQHPDNHKPYECLGTSFRATDKNNYSTWSKMTLPVIKVKPLSELSFDWGSVTKDFITHALDPTTDLDMMMVLFFQLPLSDLETKLNADSLTQNDLVVAPPLTLRKKGETSAKLFDFDLNGVVVTPEQVMKYFDADFYPPANYTFALAGATGVEVGAGIRVIQAFQLDPTSSNTQVTMTDASTKLDWTTNLHDLTPTGIPKGQSAVTLDWGDMTKTALGTVFDPTQITRALVAHYTETSGQLEKDFLNIELIASDLYETKVDSGTSVDFSTMTKKSDGKSFPGIDDNGTWLVALQCGACRNPSPWYLSILKTCSTGSGGSTSSGGTSSTGGTMENGGATGTGGLTGSGGVIGVGGQAGGAGASGNTEGGGTVVTGGSGGLTGTGGLAGSGGVIGVGGQAGGAGASGNTGAAGTVVMGGSSGMAGMTQQTGAGGLAGSGGEVGKGGASGNAGGAAGTTTVNNLPDGPVALPDGAPGIEFDDIQWGPTLRRIIVPAGRSGKVDLIDPDTSEVTALSGLSATATYKSGTRYGSTSATEAGSYIAALDQTAGKLYIFDPTTKVSVTSVTLSHSAPDYVFYVKSTAELYVTAPGTGIDVYSLPATAPPTPAFVASITGTGAGPESLAVDGKRNRAYTDGFGGSTYAIDLTKRAVVSTWSNGCGLSLGLRLDEARGFLFVSCSEGKVVVLDVANGGAKLSELSTNSGLDILAFNADLSHLYVPSGDKGQLAIMGVSSQGALSLLGNVATAANAKGVAADDRNHAWVCDPGHGQVLRITDTFPKTTL